MRGEGVGEMPCVETPRSAQSPPRPRRERSIRRGFRRVYTGSRVPVTLSSSTVIVSLNGVHSINFAFGCAYTCTRAFRSASCLFSFERSNRDWYESDPGLGRVQWSLERVISITWTAVHSGRVGGAVESAGESAHPAESGFLWRRSEGSQDSSPPGNARKSRSFYLHRYVQPPIPRQPRQPVSRQPNGSLGLYLGSSCVVRRLIILLLLLLLLFTRTLRRPLLFAKGDDPFSSSSSSSSFERRVVSFSKDTRRRKKLNGNKIESKIDIGGREFESNYNLTRWESFS